MSANSPNKEESKNDLHENPLAKAFFDKLKRDGPKLDKVGEVYVRLHSGRVQNEAQPPSLKADELNNQSNLLYDEEDKPSGARMLHHLKSEIRKEFSDIQKDLDSNLGN